MDGLANILEVIGTDPMAKWVLLAFGLHAAWSVVAYFRCPLCAASGRFLVRQRAARRQAEKSSAEDVLPEDGSFGHDGTFTAWRFLLVMVLGIAVAVVGLFKLAKHGAEAPLGFFLLILGVYLFTTEPARRQVAEALRHALAVEPSAGPERKALSVALLRDSRRKLVAIEVGIVSLMLAGMMAVGGGMM
jgi:hypothetical protein